VASRRACPLTSRPAAVTCSACCSRRTPPAAVTYGGVWRALDIYVCERGGGVRACSEHIQFSINYIVSSRLSKDHDDGAGAPRCCIAVKP